MTSCAELADYEWLTGPQAAAALSDLAESDEPLHRRVARLRRSFPAARVHLLLELSELRTRGRAKFERADAMYFTRRGLEQATDQWVAAYKARRFAGRGPVVDLCCGIGGDLLALATVAPTAGVDRDRIAAFLAGANGRSCRRRLAVENGDVARISVGDFASWHLDPDRRPDGRRTSSLAASSPDAETIARLLRASPDAAIKLAPAAAVPAAWRERCELEWISRDRQCRQLVAWHGALAASPGQRRATALTADGDVLGSIVGEADVEAPVASSLGEYLFEPDAAVLAARLAGALAAAHGLASVAPGVDYYTGPRSIDDPLMTGFAIDTVLPLDLAVLTRHLRGERIGTLEIKVRGVEHEPERLRRELKLRGDRAATLILTKLNRKRLAIVVRRIGRVNSVPPSLCPETSSHATCF